MKNFFSDLTNLYSLSKTLRFELRPVGKTRESMNKNLQFDSQMQTFLKDQEIEDAYQVLKPVFDKMHEDFIAKSLENNEAKNDFSEYFNLYEKQKNEQNKDKKVKLDELIRNEAKTLRKKFENLYTITGEKVKISAGKDNKNKDILKESGYKVLTEAGILKYIKHHINELIDEGLQTSLGKKITKEDLEKALGKKNSEGVFNKFFTYFSGFNQNRENYYDLSVDKKGEGKSTAVATRIVDENLPKFCDNVIVFVERKSEYLNAYNFLETKNITLKDKNGIDLYLINDLFFTLPYFNQCLSQKQIDNYNKQIGNANYIINLYNQQKKNETSFKKLKSFKTLYKQIGCGEKKDFIQTINNNTELKKVLEEAQLIGEKYFISENNSDEKTIYSFIDYILSLNDFKNIYWSDKAINTISGKYFANWAALREKLKNAKVLNYDKKNNEIKIPQAVMLADLFEILDAEKDWQEKGILFKDNFKENNKEKQEIIKKASTPHEALLKMICEDIKVLAKNFVDGTNKILKIEEKDYQKDENKIVIKTWLDNALYIGQILKYWKVKEKYSTDNDFMTELDSVKVSEVVKNYDVIRNYLTQKPQDEINKLKLNFENSSLAAGWDINKELDNYCIILTDNKSKHYLAILQKEHKKIFAKTETNMLYKVESDDFWNKMEYKLLPGPNKMLPKIFFSQKWTELRPTPENIKEIYKKGSFKKGNSFSKHDLWQLIDFYKQSIKENPEWECFEFQFKPTEYYESVDRFYNDVEKQGYKLNFVPINKNVLKSLIEKGRVYLFEIRNQDNNDNKKVGHKNNLHTIYWNAVFGETANKPKLNGEAEIFYCPALPLNKMKKAVAIDSKGKKAEIKLKSGETALQNFRFSKEKFIFHCPITLNFCLKNQRVNDLLNEKLLEENINFLGIDRGEKHLAYYSLINQDSKILEQGSFNVINGKNYWEELDKRQGDRDEARKNWTTIGNIKDLKDGYISQVVRKIVDLAVENNAFIVLEDLNVGFKRGRQKIEKQVYQKLELALAKKLNFLVDKNVRDGEVGSAQKAFQLTPPVNNFGDIKSKQFGIMLYVKAGYTSQIDPVTGWRKTIYLHKASETQIKKQILENFDDIGFDGKDYFFSYTDKNTDRLWKLYSSKDGVSLDRYYREPVYENSEKKWTPKKQNLVEILDCLFDGFDKNSSLLEQLKNGKNPNKINDHSAWESLRFAIELVQQIRNTGIDKQDDDFILSPARDKNGNHFDSRKIKNNALPTNGDANGAYNIARKGIIMLDRIKEKKEKPDLFIRDEDWDKWAQKHSNNK